MAIGSVSNYLKEINNRYLHSDYIRFYRGHTQKGWELLPGLFRKDNCCKQKKELEILNEVKIRFPYEFEKCENIFEIIVKIQHYGIPTRLLDITSNPLVALYFAVNRNAKTKGNSVIHILDIPKKDIKYYDNKSLIEELEKVIYHNKRPSTNYYYVKARLNNPRIEKQFGAFVLFLAPIPLPQSNIKTVEISSSHISKMRDELEKLCITRETLFPELPSFADMIKEQI